VVAGLKLHKQMEMYSNDKMTHEEHVCAKHLKSEWDVITLML